MLPRTPGMSPFSHHSSSSPTTWLKTRAHIVYPALFVLQLLLMLAWVANFKPSETGSSSSSSLNYHPSSSHTLTAQDPTVIKAIQELEQLKSEMHSQTGENKAITTTSSTPSSSTKPFLILGIPSFPRREGTDYLTRVLAAIDEQMIHDPLDPMYNQVHVWIMNNAPKVNGEQVHVPFTTNEQRYAGRPEFKFLYNDHILQDHDPDDHSDLNTDGHPGYKVRKQTRDIVRMFQVSLNASTHFMAMEDDFELCTHGLQMILHSIRKGETPRDKDGRKTPMSDWITMKFCYGFNGFLLHNNADFAEFARYLLVHQARRPPDHLMTEWSAAEAAESRAYVKDRPHLTYRYNLFNHLGHVSSLRPQSNTYPLCYHPMTSQVVFHIDMFDFGGCEHDDLSPCLPASDERWMQPYGAALLRINDKSKAKVIGTEGKELMPVSPLVKIEP